MRKLALMLMLLSPLAASGQGIVSISPRQCVWRAGDNPAWAAPNLDETGWQPYADAELHSGEVHLWVRCHADLAPLRGLAHPAIQVDSDAAYELFVNGEPVGGAGSMSSGNFSMDAVRSFPLRKPPPQSAVIAFRVAYRWYMLSRAGWLPPLAIQAGDASALRDRRAAILLARISRPLEAVICYGVIAVFGFVFLGLYLNDRSRSELLILSFECLGVAAIYMNLAASWALVDYPAVAYNAIFAAATVTSGVAYSWFFFRLAGRRVPLFFWAIVGLAIQDHAMWAPIAFLPLAQALRLAEFYDYWAAPVGLAARVAMAFAPFVAFWPYSRIARRMRPLALLCWLWGADQIIYFYVHLTELNIPGLANLYPRWNLTLVETEPITSFCVIAALIWLLLRDQRKVADERAQLAGEVQAARSVQQYLIPEQLPATPGFAVESEYRPARQVGGDFFQVLPQQADGSVLIVIGDVAGKGVEAGMLATLIVGAVRTAVAFTSDPKRILDLLNERLQGRGLVTCLALRVEPEGSITLVNAGHLPPYLNGKEIGVEGSLPLGAAPGIPFPVARFQLAGSDTLLLLTDGVAEAQNAEGQLFGFERIGELLRKGVSATEVANAAQRWGQEDDITVLTLSFAPAEVLHA